MGFKEKLPEWYAEGIEPPESKKEEGWQIGDKPPADWFNWLLAQTFLALSELQSNSQHKEEKGKQYGYASLDALAEIPEEQLKKAIDYATEIIEEHEDLKVDKVEVHGIRVNLTTGEFEYKDGEEYKTINVNAADIRDNPNLNLRVRVSDTAPPAVDGRIYYNASNGLFFIARNGQWWRLYVAGDEKLEQDPPTTPPDLESKTDTSIKLVAIEGQEYMYNGGDWQESSLFTGLNRNQSYTFYSRFKETDVHKASPPSNPVVYTTDKGTQSAPNPPTISNIESDSARVTGATGTQVRIGSGTWYDSPHTFTGLDPETNYTAYARMKETDTHYASPSSAGRNFTTAASSPGPSTLIAGDMNAGFFGEVPASEIFTASEIASACGISQGTAQFENEPWLKFAIDGKIIYRPRKAIRHSISWNSINAANCVYGGIEGKRVTKDGQTYIVRLMKGALTDPSLYDAADRGAKGSEWNRLMLPIHEQAISKAWDYPAYVEDNVPIWSHNFGTGTSGRYTDADLMTHYNHGNGSYNWCQETRNTDAARRVCRGYFGVSFSNSLTASTPNANYGWSPVLELIS